MSVFVKEIEKLLLEEISLEVPKQILNKFSTLVRESGSEDEKTAYNFLTSFLEEWKVPHQVHHPNLYLSVPKKAHVKLTSPINKEFKAKTPAFAVSTGENWGSGELVYIPSAHAKSLDTIFDTGSNQNLGDLTGKVVLTEGFPMPGQVGLFNESGVAAAIFISPGKNIHDGICTPIWGSPDLDTIDNEPKIPVLAISQPDGQELIEISQKGKVEIEFQTQHEKGWFNCPLIDIFIPGTEDPDKYVLLHGHLDSWGVGIGDNTTGDATLMEIARILHKNQDKLKRSIRIAIWPGHSTGRYAGSTWFADQFGLDLEENCIAQVNCDSPGCRWATSYDYMNWFSEVDEFCQEAIKDAVNQDSKGTRPVRAGDYSFNNIGLTSFYMLSSSIPEEVLQEKGYYPVGGCGANIEWHTEDDLIHVADYDIFEKDIKVYLTSVIRVLNEPVHPFNFIHTADELITTITSYQEEAGNHFNLSAVLEEANVLREDLIRFYANVEDVKGLDLSISDIRLKEINDTILQLGRKLITINYSRKGKFNHDPALEVLPLPDIAPAKELSTLETNSHKYNVTLNHLVRGQNKVIWAFRQARKILQ